MLCHARSLGLLTCLLTCHVLAQDSTVVLEPDHVFVFVSRDAPEARVLADAGMNQDGGDPVRSHGVSWVSFTFENFYIELGWVHDADAFREDWTWWDDPWKYRPGWKSSGASPFLLAFHRVDPLKPGLPFETAHEVNFYEGGGWVKHDEPQWPHLFVMGPRGSMPDPWWMTQEIKEESRRHPGGMRRLTRLELGTTLPPAHEAFRVLADQDALESRPSSEHVLELTFDEHRQGKTFDARPELPLVIHY